MYEDFLAVVSTGFPAIMCVWYAYCCTSCYPFVLPNSFVGVDNHLGVPSMRSPLIHVFGKLQR